MPDKLDVMMNVQAAFQRRLDPDFFNKSAEERVRFIMDHSIYLEQEVQEALYELPFFKSWKDYSKMTDAEMQQAFVRYREEMIDAWHFFMNMLIVAGFTSDMLYDMYMEKNKENHRRQDAGYDHTVSYREEH